MKAGIIDYRMGNLASVSKALEAAGAEFVISDQPAELSSADLLVLPGVGHFAAGMVNLNKLGLAGLHPGVGGRRTAAARHLHGYAALIRGVRRGPGGALPGGCHPSRPKAWGS